MDCCLSYNAEMEKRMKHAKSRLKTIRSESDEMEHAAATVEISYMADVMREIVTNGTASNCSYVNDEEIILLEQKIEKAVSTIYELSGQFYDVSRF